MLQNFLRSRRYGSIFKITLISCSVLAVLTVCYVPKKFSVLIDNDIIHQTPQPSTDQYHYEIVSKKHVPTHREKGTLPDFSNGGLIVFYHVYKTGGSTVGKLLHELAQEDQKSHAFAQMAKRYENVKPVNNKNNDKIVKNISENIYEHAKASPSRLFFTMIRKNIDWFKDCVSTVNLAATNKKLVLLELHVEDPAPDFPSLVDLGPKIEQWRALADQRGVEFFAFTLVREPVAHALSFFNFFHCRMLGSDPQSTFAAPKYLVWNTELVTEEQIKKSNEPCHIDEVHDTLFHSMDWVGTTEGLQNETLPLLTQLVLNDPSVGRENAPFKVFDKNPNGNVGMKKHDLSPKTLSKILEQTELDRGLYADVVRSFRLSDLGWDYYSPKDD
eukprot:jgi/Psemu1/180019/e_gw1.13.82.1